MEWSPISDRGIASVMSLGGGWNSSMSDFHAGLAKALATGSTIGTETDSTATQITALRLEDLNNVLTTLTYALKHLVFWRWLRKGAAFNVLYQWNSLDALGNEYVSPFYIEGGKPAEMDETFTRHTRNIRFMGIEKEITLVSELQRLGGGVTNIRTQSVKDGTTQLLKKLEVALFYAREELDTSGLAFNGLEYQMVNGANADHIIDMEGYALTPGDLDDGTKIMLDNYSDLNRVGFFLSTDAVVNFSKPYRATGTSSRERIIVNEKSGRVIVAGEAVEGYNSQFTYIPFQPSVFLGKYREQENVGNFATATTTLGSAASAITVTVEADTTSKMASGTYYYSVVAKFRDGTSVPVHTASGTAVSTNEKATVAWAAPVSGTPTSYMLFRSTVDPSVTANATEVKFMREVAPTPRSFVDTNAYRPGTGVAFLLDGEFENLCAVQLAPFMNFPLATVTTAIRYLLLLFVDIALRAPNKSVMFKNIGTTTT